MEARFGIWDHFERRPNIPTHEQYQQKIALVREAERLGFRYYHVAEHHLSPLDMAPSPSVFLAALAQATSRIRVGTGVYCLPLYHPVRLIQELCMLDNLSNGRLDVGVGRGIRAVEHQWFGVAQEEVRARFDEMLAIVTSAMSKGSMGYEGKFYRLDDVALDISPVQRPYPPLWYAGGTEAAGRGGFNFLTRNVEDIKRYWQLWEETRLRPDRVNAHLDSPRVAMTRHVVVRETYAEAERIARRSWPTFEEHWFATPVLVNEEGRAVPLRGASSRAQDFDDALKSDRRLTIGTPAMISDRLARWRAELKNEPTFDFLPAVQWGDITLDEARETLELLARDVMPALS